MRLREGSDMKQLKHMILPGLAIAMALIGSTPAAAQNVDVSAGYQFARLSQGGSGETFPYGWYVDVAGTVRPMVALVGEVGGVYKSNSGVTAHEYSYQGGVRVFSTMNPMVTPFGQVLLGGSTAGVGGSSVNAFSVQPGGGVDIKVTTSVGVRIAADYRRVFFSDTNGGGENDVRVALGLVFHPGK